VIGINFAMVREFGGSNFAIPLVMEVSSKTLSPSLWLKKTL